MGEIRQGTIPAGEWICAALGLVVLVTLVGSLAQRAMSSGDDAPDVRVETLAIERAGSGWRVDVRAWNEGGSAAEDVIIHGALRDERPDGGAPGELRGEAEVELPFVPAGSERRASLVFAADPRSGALEIEVRGFVRP